MKRAIPVSAAVATALLLAGCAGQDAGTDTAGATSAVSSSAAGSTAAATRDDAVSAASAAPAFPADAEPDTADASAGAQVTVTGIRTGRQDGFDRVVFQVGGTGTPGWDVRYVDQASSQGSGKPIAVAGKAVLQVTITGAQIPDTTGVAEYAGPNPLQGSGTSTVTEVAYDHVFEGTALAFIGTGARTPFRVFALSNPARIVVDVRDS